MPKKTKSKYDARPNDGHNWIPHNRDLKAGDILRTPLDEKKLDGPWLYGICTGGGFGCSLSTIGRAIFMRGESQDLNYVLSIRDKPKEGNPEPPFTWRWEKDWLIEIMEDET